MSSISYAMQTVFVSTAVVFVLCAGRERRVELCRAGTERRAGFTRTAGFKRPEGMKKEALKHYGLITDSNTVT